MKLKRKIMVLLRYGTLKLIVTCGLITSEMELSIRSESKLRVLVGRMTGRLLKHTD